MIGVKVTGSWNGDKVKIQGKKVVGKTSYELGLIVEGQAKLLADRKTGRMAASITTQSKDKGTFPQGKGAISSDKISKPRDDNEVLVGTPVFYAPYREFGTFKSDAHPFLRPALDLARGRKLTLLLENGKFLFADYLQ